MPQIIFWSENITEKSLRLTLQKVLDKNVQVWTIDD